MAAGLWCCRLPTHQITKAQEPAMNTQTRIPTTSAPRRQPARSTARPASYRDAPRNRDFGVRSEEHTSELQSLMRISYAVFCLKKKQHTNTPTNQYTRHKEYIYTQEKQ